MALTGQRQKNTYRLVAQRFSICFIHKPISGRKCLSNVKSERAIYKFEVYFLSRHLFFRLETIIIFQYEFKHGSALLEFTTQCYSFQTYTIAFASFSITFKT